MLDGFSVLCSNGTAPVCKAIFSIVRVQESRARLESDTETRKLLHEVSRIAERALACAKRVFEEGVPAVEAGLQRLDSFGREKCAPSVRQESRKVEPKVTYEGDPPTSPQS
jgi:hypothetical protein